MKIFIAFLLVFLSFIGGKVVPSGDTIVSSNPVFLNDPPAAYNVSVNVTWAFNSGINITNVVMTIHNLKSSQYAAMGLGQNQAMVNIKE